MKVSSIQLLVLIGLATVSLNSAIGVTLIWTNAGTGSWSVAANWSPNQVPGSTDTAVITNNGATVTLDISPTVAGITLGINGNCGAGGPALLMNNQTLTLSGPLVVNSCGRLTFDSGTLVGATNASLTGVIGWSTGTLNGVLTLTANSTLNVIGGNDHNIPNCILTNSGTITWSDGRIRGGGSSPGTLIYNLGLWDAQNDQVLNNDF